MINDTNYKKLSLFVILDAYVTKNAIVHFLTSNDQSEFKNTLIKENPKNINRINNYINYLKKELEDIEEFLNDEENTHLRILNKKRDFFDNNLPVHKRKIEWFRAVDRYPFDYSIFLTNSLNNNE